MSLFICRDVVSVGHKRHQGLCEGLFLIYYTEWLISRFTEPRGQKDQMCTEHGRENFEHFLQTMVTIENGFYFFKLYYSCKVIK
jgi:hypothetical protein